MEIDNWVAWLQARIPELKASHNAFWVKQALEGYSLEAEKKALDTSSVVGQSEQLPCDCGVMLKETTIQVFCPKCYKTWKIK